MFVALVTHANLDALLLLDMSSSSSDQPSPDQSSLEKADWEYLTETTWVVVVILVGQGSLVGLCVGLLLPAVTTFLCGAGMVALLASAIASFYIDSIWLQFPRLGSACVAVGAAMATTR